MWIIILEISIILVLVLLNGFFALSELAILSSNKTRLNYLAKQGNKNAAAAMELRNNPDEFLSAVQIWITLIGILSGLVGGATLSDELNSWIITIPFLSDYSYTISYILIVMGITFFAIVLGELFPKRVALSNPERMALKTAVIMKFVSKALKPAIYIFKITVRALSALTGMNKVSSETISDEEVKLIMEEGVQQGVFEEEEIEIVENVMGLSDSKIYDIMTHRLNMEFLEHDMSTEEIIIKVRNSSFSKFPVIKDTSDNIIGIVNTKDILLQYSDKKKVKLNDILIKPNKVLENTPVYDVLEIFKKTKEHFTLIVDENDLIKGLATTSDIMEAVIGGFSDELKPKIIPSGDNRYLIDGLMNMDDVKKELKLSVLPYDDNMFHTFGGFIITHLGIIPKEGESFSWDGWNFEIADMDGNRIDKVIVRKESDEERRDKETEKEKEGQ